MRWMLSVKTEDLPPPAGPFPEPDADEQMAFFVRLGMTIAAWQLVESSLVIIYVRAIRTGNWNGASAAFHVPSGFKNRLDMANEAMQRSGLNSEWLDRWDKLYKRLSDKSKRRNELAHGMVLFNPKRRHKDRLFVSPNVMDPSNNAREAPGEIITLTELDGMLKTFEKLGDDVSDFWQQAPWPLPEQPVMPPQQSCLRRWWANALSGRFFSTKPPPPPPSQG